MKPLEAVGQATQRAASAARGGGGGNGHRGGGAAQAGYRQPPRARSAYAISFCVALAVHASVLWGVKSRQLDDAAVEFGVEAGDSSVEVTLVAALPNEAEIIAEPTEPEMLEPEPETMPEPELEREPEPAAEPEPEAPPVTEPDMAIPKPKPTPEKTQPPVRQKLRARPMAAVQKPRAPARSNAHGDGSSTIPGLDATTQRASAGQADSRPSYLRNPHPTYPEAARAAGQEGVVNLEVMVTDSGTVASVRVTKSSGHPMLDERALSTVRDRWRFKPARSGGAAISSRVVIPIRFRLSR